DDPFASVAVTVTLSVVPASSAVAVYVAASAASFLHVAPVASQRCQPYVSVTGATPPSNDVPVAAKVSPSATSIGGETTTSGAAAGGGEAGAATGGVTAEAADAVPPGSCADTTTRSVEPASAPETVYAASVAPATSTHASPPTEQRCHCH